VGYRLFFNLIGAPQLEQKLAPVGTLFPHFGHIIDISPRKFIRGWSFKTVLSRKLGSSVCFDSSGEAPSKQLRQRELAGAFVVSYKLQWYGETSPKFFLNSWPKPNG
jgi:hypothetical protein